MTSPADLTTLSDVQAWLTGPGDQGPADTGGILSRLITTCSGTIMGDLQRVSFVSQRYTDVLDGKGNRTAFLQNWPVTSIVSVTIDGRAVGPSPDGLAYGYLLEPWDGYPPGKIQALNFVGGAFLPRGRANIQIVYVAGYLTQGEAATVPATPFQVTALQPLGAWIADGGVTYANGTALTLVAGTPSVGQYALGATPGLYQFAAADDGASVRLTYSYVPWSIREAATDLVGERYRYRTRIGEKSRSQGGQTTAAYDLSEIPAYIEKALRPYRKVLPV